MENNPTNTVKSMGVRDVDLPTVAPALVLILECQRPLASGALYSLAKVDALSLGRGSARELSGESGRERHLTIPDPKMSSRHAIIERASSGWRFCDQGATNGSMRNDERVTEASLADGDVLRLGDTFFMFRARHVSFESLEAEGTLPGVDTFVGEHRIQLARLARIAATTIPVLLRGETGVGKEVVARALHEGSGRSGPFAAVNCGAIAPTLIESQLFGHVKGAFSGAVRDEKGFVRAADGGTLFLDEVAELPAAAQSTLLRVLQQSEVVPVGSTRAIPVDVRVLSATHQPLEERMGDERFRKDLYARLAGFVFKIPPLRERREDLGLLIAALLGRREQAHAPRLRPEAAQAFLRHGWPLNVRELEQALTAAAALSRDGTLHLDDLPEAIVSPGASRAPAAPPLSSSELSAEDAAVRREIVEHLRSSGGNVSATARAMNKARQQVQRWIRRFEIERSEYES